MIENKQTIDVNTVKTICDLIRKEVSDVIVGYEDVVNDLLICLMCKGHLYMVGVPGIAKTTLAKTFSTAIGLSWKRIQFTQDMLPTDIIGHYFFDQKQQDFKLRRGPIFSQLVLADEINRSSPKTQSALIEAMQERQVTIEGTTLKLPEPFLVIATKNPIETEGVYPLPKAQLDRFLFSVEMTYLSKEKERMMLERKNRTPNPDHLVIPIKDAVSLIGCHHQVYTEDSILSYIVNIIQETRNNHQLVMGASPRAGEHLLYASKAYALIEGREYVIPDDVKAVCPKVLSHRIVQSTEAELEGISTKKILDDILSTLEIPDLVQTEEILA